MKCKVSDCYHRAFFYVMGIAGETRSNINSMFDFKTDRIKPEGMHAGGRQAAQSRSATLRSTFGTVMRRKGVRGTSRQRNCSAASLPRTSWRGLRSGIPNIAGIYPHLNSSQSHHNISEKEKHYECM